MDASSIRAWLTAFCTEYLEFKVEDAEVVASTFKGFGPTLYMMRPMHWHDLVVHKYSGTSVYAYLLGVRKTDVPSNLRLMHGHTPTKPGVEKMMVEAAWGG